MTTPPATESLLLIQAAVDYLTDGDCEGQDRNLVINMSQQMIADLIETGRLRPMSFYVRSYCDVLDGPGDAERITAEITEMVAR